MRKRMRDEGKDNSDRWLLTYADMITLLMAFFIMMYSMSVVNLSKFREVAISIRSGFGGVMKGQGQSVLGSGEATGSDKSVVGKDGSGWEVISPLVDYIKGQDTQGGPGVSISQDYRGIVITMQSDAMLFSAGKADLRPEVYPLLDTIAETLDKINNAVQIEGHTCNLLPKGTRYVTNWELSSARATNVLRYLVEKKGLNARRFAAAGYADSRPIARSDTSEGRRKNRRVELVIQRIPSVEAQMQESGQSGDILDTTMSLIKERKDDGSK